MSWAERIMNKIPSIQLQLGRFQVCSLVVGVEGKSNSHNIKSLLESTIKSTTLGSKCSLFGEM